jgi:hypothetical protein
VLLRLEPLDLGPVLVEILAGLGKFFQAVVEAAALVVRLEVQKQSQAIARDPRDAEAGMGSGRSTRAGCWWGSVSWRGWAAAASG